MRPESASTWDEARRASYLFRQDVSRPFSTDTTVWPSVFGLDGESPPPERFGFQDAWDDLDKLQTRLRDMGSGPAQPCYVIAISVFGGGRPEQEMWDTLVPVPTPAARSAEWSLLGFDVSDRWLLSGLSNCGFTPETEDVGELRKRWAPRLNRHHLFTEFAAAAEFRGLSDERVKEHAPFYVFGLWLISDLTR
jgi:hypothetical protein